MKRIRLLLVLMLLMFCSAKGYCDEIITFADSKVEAICVAQWDTNSDGKLSREEAAAVKDLKGFSENKEITSFNELQYFTGIEKIGEYCFADCSSLTSITLPSQLEVIGNSAFSRCSLTSLHIPDHVTRIGEYNQEIKGMTNVEIVPVSA